MSPAPSNPAPAQQASSEPAPSGPALLIAGHGTRDPEGVAGFTALTERVGRRSGHAVAGGFIELSEPPLRDAVTGLVGQGQRSLVAVPLMLAAAGHSKGDVPAALARETERHPGLKIRYGRPLGPHPVLLDLLAARVDAVRAGMAGPPAVLVTGRGTTDPDGNADVVKVARLLWEGRDYEFTDTAFISLARPSVPEGLERCRRLGAQRIVVARYFLFPGVLPDRVAEQTAEFAAAHP
ncbi:MAG TPA: sirohydrochlorin chelatase, partial [Streptosporangiaceae bacterium]